MKNRGILIGMITFFTFMFYVFWDEIAVNTSPHLVGTYQSEASPPNIVMLAFLQDGTFEEYYNSGLVDSGTYRKEVGAVYTLHSDKKDDYIILQENDSFYYYYRNVEDSTIFLLENLGKTPTKIIDDPVHSK